MAMQLLRFDAARRALADLVSVDEVKDWRDKSLAIQAYARQAKDKDLEIHAAENRFRAERRLGELLARTEKAKGAAAPGWKNAVASDDSVHRLADMGISRDLSSRSQSIAAIPEEEFEAVLADHRDEQRVVTGRTIEKLRERGAVHVSHNSGNNEWYTPPTFLDAARSVMGSIDLDPASCAIANETVRANTFFSLDDDGLSKEWHGHVWMNPPYAQPAISDFCAKLAGEITSGRVTQACALTNNATETAWFHDLLSVADRVCFLRGRVKFLDREGRASGAPLQGQAIVYSGINGDVFSEAFSRFGKVLQS